MFVLFIKSDEHLKRTDIIKKLGNNKVCYVCLGDTVSSITETLKEGGIDAKSMFFIDTLSSHYSEKESTETCTYVSSPSAIDEISEAISKMKERCDTFVFDDISCLLRYHEPSSILRFTNKFKTKNPGKMIYIVSRDNVPEVNVDEFIDDLLMFADEAEDLSSMPGEEKPSPETGKTGPDSGPAWPYGMSGFDVPELPGG